MCLVVKKNKSNNFFSSYEIFQKIGSKSCVFIFFFPRSKLFYCGVLVWETFMTNLLLMFCTLNEHCKYIQLLRIGT